MRALTVMAVLIGGAAQAAPQKPQKLPPPPTVTAPRPAPDRETCSEFAACLAMVEGSFEAGDFERAQRMVRQAEPLAKTPREQARVLILQGALDAQALGLSTPPLADAVRVKFKEARRLDDSATFLSIPAFARTDALETVWNEASPLVSPVIVAEPSAPKRRFPLLSTLLGSASLVSFGGAGGLRLIAADRNARAINAMSDVEGVAITADANGINLGAQVLLGLGAALEVAALVTVLFWLAERA